MLTFKCHIIMCWSYSPSSYHMVEFAWKFWYRPCDVFQIIRYHRDLTDTRKNKAMCVYRQNLRSLEWTRMNKRITVYICYSKWFITCDSRMYFKTYLLDLNPQSKQTFAQEMWVGIMCLSFQDLITNNWKEKKYHCQCLQVHNTISRNRKSAQWTSDWGIHTDNSSCNSVPIHFAPYLLYSQVSEHYPHPVNMPKYAKWRMHWDL